MILRSIPSFLFLINNLLWNYWVKNERKIYQILFGFFFALLKLINYAFNFYLLPSLLRLLCWLSISECFPTIHGPNLIHLQFVPRYVGQWSELE